MQFKPYKSYLNLLFVFAFVISSVAFVDSEASAYVTIHRSYLGTDSSHIALEGLEAGEQFGATLSKGDLNGDSVDDLIIASPFYSFEKYTWMGKVSVYFGGVDSVANVGAEPDLAFFGRSTGDQLGISLATGDFNKDGIDDLAMGSYNAGTDDFRPGRVYLVLGRAEWKSKEWTLMNEKADFEFVGKDNGDMYGVAVSFVDINVDGYDDLVVGAPFAKSTNGKKTGVVYGYYGAPYRVNRVYNPYKFFYDDSASIVLWGQKEGERFGSSLAVGNFVGGTESDLAVSAYFGEGYNNASQAGKVYLFKLGTQYKKDFYIPDGVLMGDKTNQWFGFSLNKFSDTSDATKVISYDSLVVSSFPYNDKKQPGKVFVLDGREKFEDYVVNEGSSDLYFEGATNENLLGASAGSGDFDKDGQTDLFIGAPGVGLTNSAEEGELYVFYGDLLKERKSFFVDKYNASSFVYGENADDWFGARSYAIDFNGDSYDDLVVSSRYADLRDENGVISSSNVGKVYILLGGPNEIGEQIIVREKSDDFMTRGEFVEQVVDKFDIRTQRKSFIDNCYQFREFCFYVFSSQSKYSGLTLSPDIVLYPDVPVDSPYYDAVTIGTMLGVVSGFENQTDTPFVPGALITRIQALKIVLAINQLVQPVYKFELTTMLGDNNALLNQKSYFQDINPRISKMWWYPMFANYAYSNELVAKDKWFRPDDYITKGEFDELVDKTIKHIESNVLNPD